MDSDAYRVMAERDRLLATLDAERAQWAKERDRLRAVVDATRAYMDSIDSADPTITRQYRQECMGRLRRVLRALDGSPDMGEADS
jgi:hypothetical protein